jgi:hypothetical protein
VDKTASFAVDATPESLNLIVRAVTRSRLIWLLIWSSLAPLLLLFAVSWLPGPGAWLSWVLNILESWLFLVLPHVLLGALALTAVPSLVRVAKATLIALNVALLGFLGWSSMAGPDSGEGASQVIYVVAWIAILICAFVFARKRRSARL